jgi:hypothetical protein
MRSGFLAPLIVALAGCGLVPEARPPPPPSVEAATAHLDLVIDAGIARDFDRLCELASGTCDTELQGFEHLAPTERPIIVDVSLHQPTELDGGAWSGGGVLFVLCGADGAGDPYESEVLVFDAGDSLRATAAVFWTGTGIGFLGPGDEGVSVGAPDPGAMRCP